MKRGRPAYGGGGISMDGERRGGPAEGNGRPGTAGIGLGGTMS